MMNKCSDKHSDRGWYGGPSGFKTYNNKDRANKFPDDCQE